MDFGKLVAKNWQSMDHLEESVVHFMVATKRWNWDVFGNILRRKRILVARLTGIQLCLEKYRSQKLFDLEKELKTELEGVLDNEESL